MLKRFPAIAGIMAALPALGLAVAVVATHENQSLSQGLSGLLLAYLTAVLVAVTAFYAWTTDRTRALMQHDLEQRSRATVIPRLILKLETARAGEVELQIANLSATGVWLESAGFIAEAGPGLRSHPLPVGIERVLAPYSQTSLQATWAIHAAADSIAGVKSLQTRTVNAEVEVAFRSGGGHEVARTEKYEVQLSATSAHRVALIQSNH